MLDCLTKHFRLFRSPHQAVLWLKYNILHFEAFAVEVLSIDFRTFKVRNLSLTLSQSFDL